MTAPVTEDGHAEDAPADELCTIAVIGNQRGLHARAAARFVKLAAEFKADIHVQKDALRVVATSIMGLMMLAAAKGTQIRICASGSDAAAAVTALAAFTGRKFDEE